MKTIKDIISNYKIKSKPAKKGAGSNRALILKEFIDTLNYHRSKANFEPYSAARVAVMVSHITTPNLAIFLGQCKDRGDSFSKYFHWAIKTQK